MKRIKSIFKFLRVKEWRAFLFILVFGLLMAQKSLPFPFQTIFWSKVVVLFLMSFSFLAFGYLLNDCFDVKEDSLDAKKINLIVWGKSSFLRAIFFAFFFGFLGLLLAFSLGKEVFFFSFLGIIFVILYSVPPVRLKSRPFLDLFSHGFFGGMFFFLLPFFVLKAQINSFSFFIALLIFYLSVLLEIRNHLEDYEFDKKAGLKTTVCALGKEKSEGILYLLIFLFPFFLFPLFVQASFFSFLFLIATIFFFYYFEKKQHYRLFDLYTIFVFFLLLFL